VRSRKRRRKETALGFARAIALKIRTDKVVWAKNKNLGRGGKGTAAMQSGGEIMGHTHKMWQLKNNQTQRRVDKKLEARG